MLCKHCCFACTAKGTDMTRETFKQAIALACDHESSITIGGGEPTLHPLFQEFLSYAVWELASQSNSQGSPAVFLVTNGSNEQAAVTLAHLAERGVIGCRLSQDQYHDASMVTDRVRAAFRRPQRDHYAPSNFRDEYDCRDIEKPLENFQVQRMGRGKSWGGKSMKDGCCGGLFCTPRGNLYACECKRVKLGTVAEPQNVISEHLSSGYCSQSQYYKDEIIPMMQEHREWQQTKAAKAVECLGGPVPDMVDGVKL
jgi:sulfatase maturation enzyme AslB (radical SAM superfamily)